MDRKTPDEIAAVEAAKERLRVAAAEHPLFSWVRRHPKEGVATALLLGFTFSRFPRFGRALRQGALFAFKMT